MSRAIKELIEKDLERSYAGLDSVLLVSVHGLSGVQVNELRGELRKKEIEVHVIKNRAAKRVLAQTPLAPIGSALTGPRAFVTGKPSAVEIAKELVRLAKEFPALELHSGVVEDEPELLSVVDISKRRTKAELQGEVVLLALSPARRIAGCLSAGGRIAGCVKAIIEKLEKGETIAQVA